MTEEKHRSELKERIDNLERKVKNLQTKVLEQDGMLKVLSQLSMLFVEELKISKDLTAEQLARGKYIKEFLKFAYQISKYLDTKMEVKHIFNESTRLH